ncbi:hypothetical protein GCM10009133_14180 [Cocleimonas flava]|uniref:Spy/CpxP family protein refolding chaperone n=1 Tax=Cocleimonas flava TaxID=634765 RepID=A0A4R1F0N8_9GAMM|nr:hypothetical protein [Cocleimonas flava]TCJ87786.1 hypothetical protein EV695_2301 [Cocleimonas flava]
MKIKSAIIASTIATAVSLASLSAFADGDKEINTNHGDNKSESHKKGGHHKHHRGFKKVFAQLDLTDAQKTQLKDLRKQKRDGSLTRESFKSEMAGILTAEQNAKLEQIKAQRGEHKQGRKMKREQMKSLNLTAEQKTQLRDARKALKEEMRSQRKEAMTAKMKSILTAEQYAKFETFKK